MGPVTLVEENLKKPKVTPFLSVHAHTRAQMYTLMYVLPHAHMNM